MNSTPEFTRKLAAAVVNRISTRKGWISEEARSNTPQETLKALENLQCTVGSATKTLTKNLYSKDTRFVFELIQNAEDNSYSVAHSENKPAFIHFSVYPDRIVLDTNEDGFTEDNVEAICSTGQSTKSKSTGYVGEKGIGFKSVFKVASKVHIQSGPFSFAFEHKSGDSGLGMLTPRNVPHMDIDDSIRTRIVLYFSDDTKYARHSRELLELPDSLLLFLKKIKLLQITVHDATCLKNQLSYEFSFDSRQQVGTLLKGYFGDSAKDQDRYRIYKHTVHGLPFHESRKNISEAEVILAFPVDTDGNPIIVPQYTFAFLPLRKLGFKFIIQSDFITQTSREDVVEIPWNDALLEGVADTFCLAVDYFCFDDKLQYSWLKYFPDESISDPFWSKLRFLLFDRLSKASVFRSWSGSSLRKPSELRRLPLVFLDGTGQPLLRDMNPEIYCSNKYGEHASPQLLASFGLKVLGMMNASTLLSHDLSLPESRIRDGDTTDKWHTHLCKFILSMPKSFTLDFDFLDFLQQLRIVPTVRHGWISTFDGDVFFPKVGDIEVPHDLNFKLVTSVAVDNPYRRRLFHFLGVKTLSWETVRQAIADKHNTITHDKQNLSTTEGVSHVRFLFHFLSTPPETPIYVCTIRKGPVKSYEAHLTFNDDHDAQNLLQPHGVLSAPVTTRHFLLHDYLESMPSKAVLHDMSYLQWLDEILGIHPGPKIDVKKLEDLQSIAKYHLDALDELDKAINTTMMVEELRSRKLTGDRNAPDVANSIKATIKKISSTDLTKFSVDKLLDLDFLPVRSPKGQVDFVNTNAEFAIIDQETYAEIFASQIEILDFTLKEVQMMKPLIKALNLQDRYLSAQIISTITTDGKMDAERSESLRTKAGSITRCAEHYGSHLVKWGSVNFRALMATVEVWPCTNVTEVLTIEQSGATYTHECPKGNFHLDSTEDRLRVYVPEDPEALEMCMTDQLPKRLCEMMGLSDIDLELVLTQLMETTDFSVMDEHLKTSGVGPLSGSETPKVLEGVKKDTRASRSPLLEFGNPAFLGPSSMSGKLPVSAQTSDPLTPEVSESLETFIKVSNSSLFEFDKPQSQDTALLFDYKGSSSLFESQGSASKEKQSRQFERASSDPGFLLVPSPIASSVKPILHPAQDDGEYHELLDQVIKAARRDGFRVNNPIRARKAASSVVDDGFTTTKPLRAPFGVREQNQFAHDAKIGAAGELYVFEMLSQMGLYQFSRDNWTSVIRKVVSVHSDYQDLQPWLGIEPADILYKDRRGELTSYLLERGFLDTQTGSDIDQSYRTILERLKHVKPDYYIEVKTTTRSRNEKFFMSRYQYHKMGAKDLRSTSQQGVYLIFRVYNLGKADMGVDLYFNPKEFERQGGLNFVTEQYSVQPKPCPLTQNAVDGLPELGSQTKDSDAGKDSDADEHDESHPDEDVSDENDTGENHSEVDHTDTADSVPASTDWKPSTSDGLFGFRGRIILPIRKKKHVTVGSEDSGEEPWKRL